MGELRKAVNRSIKYGISHGTIDEDRDAAVIAMTQHMADILDSDGGQSSIMRYVSPSAFLTYCQQLGLVPGKQNGVKPDKQSDKIIELVGNSKWKKRANG